METYIDKKFYVPDIQEFHIGFEYEWLNENNEWIKENSPKEISPIGYVEQEYGLRVKCLDKDDIESLGFEYIMTSYDGYFRKGETQISFSYDNKIQISTRMWSVLFDIKNKSELKVVLKQLNII